MSLVLRGTFWNGIQYLLNSAAAFVMVYLLTRHFSQSLYGVYSYLLWLVGIMTLVANLGLTTTLQAYVPKYFYNNQSSYAYAVARRLLKIQLVFLGVIVGVLFIFLPWWQNFISFQIPNLRAILLVIFCMACFQILNTFFTTYNNALQRFKMTSLVTSIGVVANFSAVIILIKVNAPLIWFFVPLLGIYLLQLIYYLIVSRPILKSTVSLLGQDLATSRLLRFSFLAYVNILLQTVVWDKSELFFLAKFHPSDQLAIYSIAYTVSLTLLALFDPFIQVLINILSEVVSRNDQNRTKIILDISAKFMASCILPVITVLFFFGPMLFSKLFGLEYQSSGVIVAWLVLSAGLSRIFATAWAIPTYKFDLKRVVQIEIALTIVNIVLGFLIIPRFGFIGATVVNVSTQLIAWLVFSIYIRKFNIRIITKEIGFIGGVNVLLFGLLAVGFELIPAYGLRIGFAVVTLICYAALLRRMISSADKDLFLDIMRRIPILNRFVQSPVN